MTLKLRKEVWERLECLSIQELFKVSVVERMIQVDYIEFYKNPITWNSVALRCLGFTCYLPRLSNPVFMERKKKEREFTQSCPTLCNSMDCPSMEFPRQEYWSGLPFPSPVFMEGVNKKICIYISICRYLFSYLQRLKLNSYFATLI